MRQFFDVRLHANEWKHATFSDYAAYAERHGKLGESSQKLFEYIWYLFDSLANVLHRCGQGDYWRLAIGADFWWLGSE